MKQKFRRPTRQVIVAQMQFAEVRTDALTGDARTAFVQGG